MSSDPAQAANEPGVSTASAQPSEEELRAAYEAEISRVSSQDMILQAVVSLLNIGGHRLGLSPQASASAQGAGDATRDLEQVRDAIDGVRALLPVLERHETESLRPLRDALSQLQMAYAREAGAVPAGEQRQTQSPAGKTQSSPGDPASSDRAPGGPAPGNPAQGAAQEPAPGAERGDKGPGPAESSGRLWVPGR